MSLIIAKVLNGHIRIESDTRIMLKAYAEGHFLGRVKAVIITPEIVVCSAGNVYYFETVLEKIKGFNQIRIEDLLQILLDENINSKDETSYLIGLTGGQNEIIKIESGILERKLTTAWIGDKKGFQKFQWHYLPVSKSGLVKRLGIDFIMSDSFKGVIDDENIETVGDIQVSIVSVNGKFRYTGIGLSVPSVKSINENIENGIYPLEEVPLKLSAENGDYEAKFIAATDGLSFGLYYPFGFFGVFIIPNVRNSFSIFNNCSLEEFRKKVQDELLVEI